MTSGEGFFVTDHDIDNERAGMCNKTSTFPLM